MRRLMVATGLVACLGVAGCSDTSPGAEIGDIVQGRLGDLEGDEHVVQVPTGQIGVVVGEPSEAVRGSDAADGQFHAAPDGATWVPIDWHYDSSDGLTPSLYTIMLDDEARTTISITAGGRTYELGEAGTSADAATRARTGGIVYVALPADEAPVVTVDFAGETAEVDTSTGEVSGDVVDAMAAVPEAVDGDCSGGTVDGGRAEVTCVYTLFSVPYLGGRGWSDDGFTVAFVRTQADEFTRGEATYATSTTAEHSELLGAGDSTHKPMDIFRASLISHVEAEGSASVLRVRRTLEGSIIDGTGPDTAEVTYEARVPLGRR